MNEESTAAKAAAQGVPVTFGDPPETHILKFDLFAFMELDRVTGKNPLTSELWVDPRPSVIAALIWAATLHEGKGETVESLARKISMSDLKSVGEKLMLAYSQAMPPADEKKTANGAADAQAESSTTPAAP